MPHLKYTASTVSEIQQDPQNLAVSHVTPSMPIILKQVLVMTLPTKFKDYRFTCTKDMMRSQNLTRAQQQLRWMTVWPQWTWAKNWGTAPILGAAGSSSNTKSPGPRPTAMVSFILIHPTVWPQYTNITDRQDNGPIEQGEPCYKQSPQKWVTLTLTMPIVLLRYPKPTAKARFFCKNRLSPKPRFFCHN